MKYQIKIAIALLGLFIASFTKSKAETILQPSYGDSIASDTTFKVGNAGHHLQEAAKAIVVCSLTPFATAAVVSVVMLTGGPIAASIIFGLAGTGIGIGYFVILIKELKKAGFDLYRLEESVLKLQKSKQDK
jgi:hypothetical protein